MSQFYFESITPPRARLLDHPCATVPGGAWGASVARPGEVPDAAQPPVPGCRTMLLTIPGPGTVPAGLSRFAPENARERQPNAKSTVVLNIDLCDTAIECCIQSFKKEIVPVPCDFPWNKGIGDPAMIVDFSFRPP